MDNLQPKILTNLFRTFLWFEKVSKCWGRNSSFELDIFSWELNQLSINQSLMIEVKKYLSLRKKIRLWRFDALWNLAGFLYYFNKHMLIQRWVRHDSYRSRSLESSEEKCNRNLWLKYQTEGKTNFGKVPSNTEGTRSRMLKMIILKQLFQPRSNPLTSQETEQAPHSFTPFWKVGESILLFLIYPRGHFQFNNWQVDFPSKRLLLGPNHSGTCGPRSMCSLKGR